MIILYGFGPKMGLPEAGAFAMKSQIQLKMAGISFEARQGAPPMAPKRKIPFIEVDGVRIGDSTLIHDFISREFKADLDEGLTACQRATSWAIERMLEDHLFWAINYFRWLVPENFERGPAKLFDLAPEAARPAIRAQALETMRNALFAQGLGRHDAGEIADLGGRSITALSSLLGSQPYIMGDKPSSVDATAFAMIANALAPLFDSELRQMAEDQSNLVAYSERMMKEYYPDFLPTGH